MSNSALTALVAMQLKDVPRDMLAAMNNGIQMYSRISPGNMGYKWALENQLITEAGNPTFDLDVTQDAFAYEVLRRAQDGEWD